MSPPITEHYAKTTSDGGLNYLACGPEDGPLLVFVHGWPELAISWRNQLPVFGAMGFRAVAPDMPGYGRSVVYRQHEGYSIENIVRHLCGLQDALGQEKAVWIGHDWGSPMAWAMASHHPERCHAVASLCVPYCSVELGFEHLISTVDRTVYPADRYPNGQWDYQVHYVESFEQATTTFDTDPANVIKALFTRGDPTGIGKPAMSADIRRNGGWFGPDRRPPEMPLDEAVLGREELHQYASALERNGFFGPDSYYMNHERNAAYHRQAVNDGNIDMPSLFLMAEYDFFCECVRSTFADEMRRRCSNLTSVAVASSHWMAQEKPQEVNAALAHWLATKVGLWPAMPEPGWRKL